MGNRIKMEIGIDGLDQLLHCLHLTLVIPKSYKTANERFLYLQQNSSLIFLPIALEPHWYRKGAEPLLIQDQEGTFHLLTADRHGTYRFWDEGAKKRRKVSEKNQNIFTGTVYQVFVEEDSRTLRHKLLTGGRNFILLMTLFLLTALIGYSGLLLVKFVLKAAETLPANPEFVSALRTVGKFFVIFLVLLVTIFLRWRQFRHRVEKNAEMLLPAMFYRRIRKEEGWSSLSGLREMLIEAGKGWELLQNALLLIILGVGGCLLFPQCILFFLIIESCLLIGAYFLWRFQKPLSTSVDTDIFEEECRRQLMGKLLRSSVRWPDIVLPTPKKQGNTCLLPLLLLPLLPAATLTGKLSASDWIGFLLVLLMLLGVGMLLFYQAEKTGSAYRFCKEILQSGEERSEFPPIPTGTEPVLELFDVTVKRRDGTLILDHISLSVKKGEKIGILGRNGAGKTVLAQVITGIRPPDQGELYYGGYGVACHQKESLRSHISTSIMGDLIIVDGVAPAVEAIAGKALICLSVSEEALGMCDKIFELKEGKLDVWSKTNAG